MINNLAQNIALGPRQLSMFETEQEARTKQDRLKDYVVQQIETQGKTDLWAVVQGAADALDWSSLTVLQHLFWLARDFEIIFKTDHKIIPPRIAKALLIESDDQKVTIALNEPVDESTCLRAMTFCQQECSHIDIDEGNDQATLARFLASLTQNYKSSLESLNRHAFRPGFPGKQDIKAGLSLIGELSKKNDSFSLIGIFYEKSKAMEQLAHTVKALTDFYTHHKHRWQEMLDFACESRDTLAGDMTNPAVAYAYERFKEILSSARPYDQVDEAAQLLKPLRIHHHEIIARRTEQCREEALSNIEVLIEKMKALLQAHAADNDRQNQSLYPLRAAWERIKTAGTRGRIDQLMQEAWESFDIRKEELLDSSGK